MKTKSKYLSEHKAWLLVAKIASSPEEDYEKYSSVSPGTGTEIAGLKRYGLCWTIRCLECHSVITFNTYKKMGDRIRKKLRNQGKAPNEFLCPLSDWDTRVKYARQFARESKPSIKKVT